MISNNQGNITFSDFLVVQLLSWCCL